MNFGFNIENYSQHVRKAQSHYLGVPDDGVLNGLFQNELVKFWNDHCEFEIYEKKIKHPDDGAPNFDMLEVIDNDYSARDRKVKGHVYLLWASGSESSLREKIRHLGAHIERSSETDNLIILLREDRFGSREFRPHGIDPDVFFKNVEWVESFRGEIYEGINSMISFGLISASFEEYINDVSFCGIDGEVIPKFGSTNFRYIDYLPHVMSTIDSDRLEYRDDE